MDPVSLASVALLFLSAQAALPAFRSRVLPATMLGEFAGNAVLVLNVVAFFVVAWRATGWWWAIGLAIPLLVLSVLLATLLDPGRPPVAPHDEI